MKRYRMLLAITLLLAVGCKDKEAKQPPAESSASGIATPPAPESATTSASTGTLVPNAAVKSLTKAPPKDPKALVAAAVAHKGGLEALSGVKSVTSESIHEGVLKRRVKVWLVYPDKIRVDYRDGETLEKSLIINGSNGYQVTKGSVVNLPAGVVADIKKATLGEVMPLLVAASKQDAELAYLGQTEVQGQKADVVKVKLPDLGEIIFFTAVDGGAFLGEQIPLKAGLQTVIESDYKIVGGVNIAHKTKVLTRGQVIVSTIENVTINPKLAPDVFEPTKHPLNR